LGYLKYEDRMGRHFFDGGRAGGFGDHKTVNASLLHKRSARELIVIDPSKDEVIEHLIGYIRTIELKKTKGPCFVGALSFFDRPDVMLCRHVVGAVVGGGVRSGGASAGTCGICLQTLWWRDRVV
jgi:hypothetical protein